MSGFAAESEPSETDETPTDEDASLAELAKAVQGGVLLDAAALVSWANTRLISGDAVEAVAVMKRQVPTVLTGPPGTPPGS